jgi:DNA primase catalytic subunit
MAAQAGPRLDAASEALLRQRFAAYYATRPPLLVDNATEREWMVSAFDGKVSRHIGIRDQQDLEPWLASAAPLHVYHSLACYHNPRLRDMATKHAGRKRWEVLLDLDVTPDTGGSVQETLSEALARAKQQFLATLQILEWDLGIGLKDCTPSFSGSKGYHARLTREDLQQMSAEARSELGRYIGGFNTPLADLFPGGDGKTHLPAAAPHGGLKRRIWLAMTRIRTMAHADPRPARLVALCQRYNTTMASPESILDQIRDAATPQALLGPDDPVGTLWYAMARYLACPSVDQSAVADASRMVRLQGSLNGKSGLVCRPLTTFEEIERFNPLVDANPHRRDVVIPIRGLRPWALDIQGQRFAVQPDERQSLPENAAVVFVAAHAAAVEA